MRRSAEFIPFGIMLYLTHIRNMKMHMQNELLSPPVAAVTFAAASLGIGFICKKAQKLITHDKLALMGIMGAFVFAGQMVNLPLPLLPGTSGHLTGALLLAVLRGPWASAIVMSSVVIVQCLIFMDGGIMALGCNLINMAIVPSFVGYGIYKLCMHNSNLRLYTTRSIIAVMIACLASVIFSSRLVPLEASASGIIKVPLLTFIATMVSVHCVIGVIEGLITIAVLGYLQQVVPDIFESVTAKMQPVKRRKLYVAMAIATVVVGAGLSIFASSLPDGLEWSYAERPDQLEFTGIVENTSPAIKNADHIHEKISLMPDYSIRTANSEAEASAGWTSFAGVTGSIITMVMIWFCGRLIHKKETVQNAPHAH